MLELVLGTSGSGKTSVIHEKILGSVKNGEKVMLIVPEQYSFESERALFERLGAAGMRTVEVLSFKRLANSIFREYGGLSASYVDDAGKLLAMSAALAQLGDQLDFYAQKAAAVHSAAFIAELVKTADEMKNACVTPDAMRAAALLVDEQHGTLAKKTGELALILETYQAILEQSGSDPADELVRACRLLEGNDFFAGYTVYLDSFNDFTADELMLLGHVIRGAKYVGAALETDGLFAESDDGCGLFSIVRRTAARLMRIARESSVPVASPVICRQGLRFRKAAVAHLEANLFRERQAVFEGEPEGVRLIRAQDAYEEFERIAAEIRRLTCEEGLRCREVAVIVRSVPQYADAMGAAFEKYGVPFFCDRRTPVVSKPLMTLVICASQIAAEGFATETLLRLAKTGLAGLDGGEIAKLEDYAYIWKLNGSRWAKEFTQDPFGFSGPRADSAERLAELEKLRKRLVGPLLRLRGDIKGGDGEAFARGIYDYLTRLKTPERLEELAQGYEEIGEAGFADELEPLWELTISLLEQFASILRGVTLPESRFAELFRMAAAGADIAGIPRTVDQVTVGSADRIRTGSIRAVFVAGVNDGEFPAEHSSGGVLTDLDRELLSKCGLDIAGSYEDMPLFERLFLYNAATCASERVCFSFKLTAQDGSQMRPAAVIGQLTRMFPELKTEDASGEKGPEDVWNAATAFSIYAAGRRESADPVFTASLREHLLTLPDFEGRVRRLDESLTPESFRIDDAEASRRLIGNKLRLAPSNIERYFDCRFKYFCCDCLRIRKKLPAEMSPTETGTLIHYVLEQMLKRHEARELSGLSRAELERELDELLRQYLDENLGGTQEKDSRFIYLYRRLKNGLVRLLQRLGDEFENCDFSPAAFELPIKEDASPVSSVKLITEEGVEIVVEGYVDRVDVMEKDGRRYVRVVDYKSGGKKFRLSDVYYGLNLQMLIYLFSIYRNGTGAFERALPAGVLYLLADGSVIDAERGASDEAVRLDRRKNYRMNGLILSDVDSITGMDRSRSGMFIPAGFGKSGQLLREDTSASLASLEELGRISEYINGLLMGMAQTLLNGDISALPAEHDDRTACDYCDYAEICRRSPEDPVRETAGFKSKADFYRAIGGENGGERDAGTDLD